MSMFIHTYTCTHRVGVGKRRGQGERGGERNAHTHTLMNTYTHIFARTYTKAYDMNGKTSQQSKLAQFEQQNEVALDRYTHNPTDINH